MNIIKTLSESLALGYVPPLGESPAYIKMCVRGNHPQAIDFKFHLYRGEWWCSFVVHFHSTRDPYDPYSNVYFSPRGLIIKVQEAINYHKAGFDDRRAFYVKLKTPNPPYRVPKHYEYNYKQYMK